MKLTKFVMSAACVLAMSACCNQAKQEAPAQRWSEEKANEWYAQLPWLAGADYINADAINQI